MKKKIFLVFMAILGMGIQASNGSNQDFNDITEADKVQVDRLIADFEKKGELESFLAEMYEEIVEKPARWDQLVEQQRKSLIRRLNVEQNAITAMGGIPRLRIPASGLPYYENFIAKDKNPLISQFSDMPEDEIHRIVAFGKSFLSYREDIIFHPDVFITSEDYK